MINHLDVTFIKLDRQSFFLACFLVLRRVNYTQTPVYAVPFFINALFVPTARLIRLCDEDGVKTVANTKNFIRTNVKINYDLWYKL
jgi:hypothetical protein